MNQINDYLRRFLNTRAAPDVLALFSLTNNVHKEITESWAMLEAARKYCGDLSDKLIIVVGDGSQPRTGVMFSFYTKAEVISIDPQFQLGKLATWWDRIMKLYDHPPQRLQIMKGRIEEACIDAQGKDVVVVHPHSHAGFEFGELSNYKSRSDICMPCCNPIPHKWAIKPHIVYKDHNVLSPKQDIHIWTEVV